LVPPYLAFVSGVPLQQKGARLPLVWIFYAALAFATLFVAVGAPASSLPRFLTACFNWLTPLAGLLFIASFMSDMAYWLLEPFPSLGKFG
jgi:cytochrome c biogenesis protein CcdA